MPHNPPLRLFPHEDETIEGVSRALREGKTTCAAVLERCFHQIDLWDEKVKAWVYLDRAGAMAQARALDEELKAGTCRGPLHGIPFGIKDIIDVAGMPTACGFPPWRDRVMEKDAEIVRRLREGGAVILGKTVTTQFAWIDPPPTRNPWNLERTPGGSSSGSAAAVATGMCLGAIGTQTGGSIIRPAAFCGVVGFKTGYYRLSDEGIMPFAPSLDHTGLIARTVLDLALIDFSVSGLSWTGERDVEKQIAAQQQTTFTARGPTLIRTHGYFDRRSEPETFAAFEAALESLVDAGAEVIDMAEEAIDFEAIVSRHRVIMAAEAAAMHEARFATHRDEYAPHIRALIEEGLATRVTRYIEAELDWRRAGTRLWAQLQGIPGNYWQIAIVTPSTVGPAPDASTTGNPCLNAPWSYLGWPAVTIPMSLAANGLPLGLQVIVPYSGTRPDAAAWCEAVFRRTHEEKGE